MRRILSRSLSLLFSGHLRRNRFSLTFRNVRTNNTHDAWRHDQRQRNVNVNADAVDNNNSEIYYVSVRLSLSLVFGLLSVIGTFRVCLCGFFSNVKWMAERAHPVVVLSATNDALFWLLNALALSLLHIDCSIHHHHHHSHHDHHRRLCCVLPLVLCYCYVWECSRKVLVDELDMWYFIGFGFVNESNCAALFPWMIETDDKFVEWTHTKLRNTAQLTCPSHFIQMYSFFFCVVCVSMFCFCVNRNASDGETESERERERER